MNDEKLNALVADLQQKIYAEAKEAYGEAGYERWRNPRYNGRMNDATVQARRTGGCGDTIEMYLKFDADRVVKASYTTDGCGSSSLCGSYTAQLALGKTPDELYELTGDQVLHTIGKFPKEEVHCATLAVETLQEAVNSYMIQKTRQKQ